MSANPLPLPSSQQMVQAFHPFPLRGLLGWDLNASTVTVFYKINSAMLVVKGLKLLVWW